MKPVIGVTANYQAEQNGYFIREFYMTSIVKAGGIAIILPSTLDRNLINEYFRICKGLLLSGGGDLDPGHWGDLAQERAGEIDPIRDEFELISARKALQERKPILGICRGCQLMNVAAGGTLVQDIVGPMSHKQKAPRAYPFHDIFIDKGSQLHDILGSERIRVNSFHHQAVKKTGRSLAITAMAADGTIEAIESREHTFYQGVQWHPECLGDEYSARLFMALITAAQI